jgi:hypothetical protein
MECHVKLGNADRVRYYHKELTRKFPKSEHLPAANKLLKGLEKKKPTP